MFTGLIHSVARVVASGPGPAGIRLVLEPSSPGKASIGASVAVDGCCLTIADFRGDLWAFDVVPETLSRTTLGRKSADSLVNLELAMRHGDRLEGHLVQGHVDAIGSVLEVVQAEGRATLTVSLPASLQGMVVEKGSIAVDGVSLTVASVGADSFRVALVPHTLKVTTLSARVAGDEVNLEADIIAKYVAAQLARTVAPARP